MGGFLRGFVQETLSLMAWVLAIFAIRLFHTDLTTVLYDYIDSPSGATILAFVLLLGVPYAAMKLIAGYAGRRSRRSVLGPVDRVLGFAFGALKGVVIVVMVFSLVVLGFDLVWGPGGRPDWITQARTYRAVNASSNAMVQLVRERQRRWKEEAEEAEEAETETEAEVAA